MSRVNAREVAQRVAQEGHRWAVGAGGGDAAALAGRIGLPAIAAAQAGLVADMDETADHMYHRR
jgi:hypothetical protein